MYRDVKALALRFHSLNQERAALLEEAQKHNLDEVTLGAIGEVLHDPQDGKPPEWVSTKVFEGSAMASFYRWAARHRGQSLDASVLESIQAHEVPMLHRAAYRAHQKMSKGARRLNVTRYDNLQRQGSLFGV